MSTAIEHERSATAPPEARGIARDAVRLLVASRDGIVHATFRDLPRFLRAGDVLVVNTSATLPSAVPGTLRDPGGDRPVTVHLASPDPDADAGAHTWVVELRRPDGSGPVLDAEWGAAVALRPGGAIRLVAPVEGQRDGHARLWRADVDVPGDVEAWLARHGRPIRYGYVPDPWPLSAYQTVFARHPGSAEMPSAGRPFTDRLVVDLVTAGVVVVPITLHTALSSQEAGEPPQPERLTVPPSTATTVNAARAAGGRVVAVGTTVTRALETAADPAGWVSATSGWTDTVLGPDRPVRVVDGIVTGWHEDGASHLELLRAVAGEVLVDAAYDEAHDRGYAWHEFGDSALFLP